MKNAPGGYVTGRQQEIAILAIISILSWSMSVTIVYNCYAPGYTNKRGEQKVCNFTTFLKI